MDLITNEQRSELRANGRMRMHVEDFDPVPVVKLFTPDAACTWLLSELDPADEDCAFGLCDLGLGFPELGTVSLRELASVRGRLGLPVERDRFVRLDKPLSVYAEAARTAERIIV